MSLLHPPDPVDRFVRTCELSLGRQFHASRIVLATRPPPPGRSRSGAGSTMRFLNWPEWCGAYYRQHVLGKDPIGGWLDSLEAAGGAAAARLSDMISLGALRRRPALRTMLDGSGARHVLTIALNDGGRMRGALSLVREAGTDDFTEAERQQAASYAPLLLLALQGVEPAGLPLPAGGDGGLQGLTPREREVARLVCAGLANKQVARRLEASPWTIKNHLRAVYEKTGAHNRTELCARLAAAGVRAGLLPG